MGMELKDVLALGAIILTLIGGYWALAKFVGQLFTQQLDTKFAAMNERFDNQFDSLSQRLTKIEEGEQRNNLAVSQVERDLMKLRAELPEKYVRSEDYIRGQSRIEAKIDSLAGGLQRAQLRG